MKRNYFTLFLVLNCFFLTLSAQNQYPVNFVMTEHQERFDLPQGVAYSEINLCGLEKNATYEYWIAGEIYSFIAENECFHLPIPTTLTENNNFEISVGKVKMSENALPATTSKMLANIGTDNSYIPFELIRNILVGGNCFDVDNVQKIGNINGIGSFYSGAESIGIENGVILSTGLISDAPGPNDTGGAGTNLNGDVADSDLQSMATNSVNDAVGIEFDFTPTTEMIEFEYVFASEEYCEYVNSSYNDVFGFFISGPGIDGEFQFNGENIALIPNSEDNVSINNINHLLNSEYFVPNATNCGTPAVHPETIQYDGFTSVLTASAQVIPCETYHIRLVVGDVGDGLFDSAVFLRANSFNASGGAEVVANSPYTNTNTTYEGCENGEFIFSRDEDDELTEDLEIEFFISPTSTAAENQDYAPFPTTITIPAGEMSATLPVEIIADGLAEGEETLIIEVPSSCSCSEGMVEMILQDVEPMQIQPTNPDICGTESVVLTAATQGGMGAYQYEWSDGTILPTITVPPFGSGTQTYSVTVTDECGNESAAQSIITALAPPEAIISGEGDHCAEDAETLVNLMIEMTGNGPWELTYSKDGILQTPIVTTDNPHFLSVNGIGDYVLENISYTDGYCPGTVSGAAQIVESELPTAFISGNGSFCEEDTGTFIPLTIEFTGSGPWEFTYSQNGIFQESITTTDNPYILEVNEIGTYSIGTVTYLNGYCNGTTTGSAEITPTNPPTAFLSGTGELCPDQSDTYIDLPVEFTGNGPWEISYSYNGTLQETITITDNPYFLPVNAIGNYSIESVSYANGLCNGEVAGTAQITAATIDLNTEITDAECAETNTGSIKLTGANGAAPYNFTWNDLNLTGNNPTNLLSGEYAVTMTDANGCLAETVAFVAQPPRIVVDLEKTEGLCEGDKGSISVSAAGGIPPFVYALDATDFTDNSIFSNLDGGDFNVFVQDLKGCEWTGKIEITEPRAIDLWTEPNVTIALGDSHDIQLETNIPYSEIDVINWTNEATLDCSDCFEPTANPFISTPYQVTITTDKGCTETTETLIQVDRSDTPVFVPNVFSPNGDGINDRLTIFAKETAVINVKSMSIVSRWGEMVFVDKDVTPNDLGSGWDGVFRGKPVDSGVFLWYAEVEYIDGSFEMLKGDVTVMR